MNSVAVLRVVRLVHRWIGIALAVPVAAVAVTGGLLLLKGPYYRAAYPELARPLAVDAVAAQAQVLESLGRSFPDAGVRTVKFPRAGANAFHVYLTDATEAFVDPSTGRVIARWNRFESLPAFLFDLHAHLLTGASGETVNGLMALGIVFFGLSGVLLWWPYRRSAYRLQRAVPASISAAALLRSHAASGVLLVIPVLLFAATGAGLVFYDQVSTVVSAALDDRPPQAPSAQVARRNEARRPWLELLEAARATLPDAPPVMVYTGVSANAVVTFRTRLPGEWHPNGRSYVLVDPYDGRVLQAIDAREQGVGTRAMHAFYPIHAAMIGGPAMTVLAIVASAGLAFLAGGGLLAWIGRSVRRRGPAKVASGPQRASRSGSTIEADGMRPRNR